MSCIKNLYVIINSLIKCSRGNSYHLHLVDRGARKVLVQDHLVRPINHQQQVMTRSSY